MGSQFDFIVFLVIPAAVLLAAWIIGNLITAHHEESLKRRQEDVAHIRVTNMKTLIDSVAGDRPPALITGEVTMGIDHFRGFLGKLKNIFGGEVRSYQTTLDRARREVVMRLIEEAHKLGYDAVANMRIDFADISGNATRSQKASSVSILGSATAYHAATSALVEVNQPVTEKAGA